jgi:NADH dehydrogenase
MKIKKVIIIGAGFGGLASAKELKSVNFDVTVIDKTNHHLFQPLLYQVATAALSPADIAIPIRSILAKQSNTKVILDEVISIDKEKSIIKLKNSEMTFDYLIIATGASHSYFGNEKWEKYAPGLKTLVDALTIRENIISSLELAEKETDLVKKKQYLTFVIVGGGPTGVELAGAIAEIAKKTIIKDYKNFHTYDTNIILIEALPKILNTFQESLSKHAQEELKKMGVDIMLNTKVLDINENGVKLSNGFIETANIIWAAGNVASPIIKTLNIKTDNSLRVFVESDCSIPNYPNIFVIGDAANLKDQNGNILPGIAPVAIQQGKYVGRIIAAETLKENRKPFRYIDKGTMAAIGKANAVAQIKGLKFSGYFAWLMWSFIHIAYLISFRNRFRVMVEWIWYYFTNKHGTRLIIRK